MSSKFKRNLIFPLVILFSLILGQAAQAVCPVCTVAVGACVGFSRWLGVDDLISGVWIGGVIVSIIIWFLSWLDKKQIRFKLRWLVVSVLFYLIVFLPLCWTGIIGHPFNRFYGVDKLLFGTIFGSMSFLLAVWFGNFLKKRNQGKPLFPFQKVLLPILFLLITSLIFYYIISC